jgi:hypothetical protein
MIKLRAVMTVVVLIFGITQLFSARVIAHQNNMANKINVDKCGQENIA